MTSSPRVADKILAFLSDGRAVVTWGANRDEVDEWLLRDPGDAFVMAYIGRSGWNTLELNGAMGRVGPAVEAQG